eukprot:scaffold106_cov380-Prasinococcus_capsulatus_cf.AAC.73
MDTVHKTGKGRQFILASYGRGGPHSPEICASQLKGTRSVPARGKHLAANVFQESWTRRPARGVPAGGRSTRGGSPTVPQLHPPDRVRPANARVPRGRRPGEAPDPARPAAPPSRPGGARDPRLARRAHTPPRPAPHTPSASVRPFTPRQPVPQEGGAANP